VEICAVLFLHGVTARGILAFRISVQEYANDNGLVMKILGFHEK
jgi:hypothetical protein